LNDPDTEVVPIPFSADVGLVRDITSPTTVEDPEAFE